MKLKKNDKIEIDSMVFTVKNVRDINFTHTDIKKTYYTYTLSSIDENVTNVSLDYIDDSDITLHLTKKVKSKIKEKVVMIDSISYTIESSDVEIFMDHGEHKDVILYKLKGESSSSATSELHVLPDNTQIFYLNKKITISDIKIKK